MISKAQLKRRMKKVFAIFTRSKLKNRDFSILSNNCWGGVVYDKYGLQYNTPTIGLWIPPTDYVRFLNDPNSYFDREMIQIHYKDCHVADLLLERKKSGRYAFDLDSLIIGRIDDIDIIFIHYKSFDEAKDKWDRRKKRVNWDNLVVKFNDQNGCTERDYEGFCELQYNNKLFFTANKRFCTEPFCIYLSQYKREGYVVNDTTHGDVPLNITKYLNNI